MGATSADLKLRLSGGTGNSSAAAALGGAASTSSNAPAGLFRDVTAVERGTGITLYRCIYLKNVSTTDQLISGKVWVNSDTASGTSAVAIGLGSSAVNGTEQTVGSETTAPSAVSFSAPVDSDTGLTVPTLNAGATMALWVRLTVNAGTAALPADDWSLRWGTSDAPVVSAPVLESTSAKAALSGSGSTSITVPALQTSQRVFVVVFLRDGDAAVSDIGTYITAPTATGVTFTLRHTRYSYGPPSPDGIFIYEGVVNSAGATSISVGGTLAAGVLNAYAMVLSNTSAAPAFDVTSAGYDSTSLTYTVGPTNKADSLAFAAGWHNTYNQGNVGWLTPSGYTQLAVDNTTNGMQHQLVYKVLSSTSSYSITHTSTYPAQYGMYSVSFTVKGA